MAEPTPKSQVNKAPARPSPGAAKGRVSAARARPLRERLPVLANQPATLIGVVALVVLVVLVLVVLGYWNTYIGPARETAVRVGNRSYDMAYFTRRMKAYLTDPLTASVSASQVLALPERLAQDIIEEEILLQRAQTLGVGVSDAEIDALLAEKLGIIFSRDEHGNVQQTPAFASAVRNALQRSGLSVAEYRRAVHAQQLRLSVRKHFESQIPQEMPAVLLRQLAVSDEAKAKELKQRIEGGADFAALVAAQSEDTLTKDKGGLRDWAPKGFLPDEFEQEAFTLPVGAVSAPFQSGGKWFIYRVEEREEARVLTDQERSQLATKHMSAWLDEQRKSLTIENHLNDPNRQSYALEHSGALARLATTNPAGRPTLPLPGSGSNP